MDRFLVRTPRGQHPDSSGTSSGKQYRQTTIESLRGVVVIEDILRIKALVKLENQTAENILSALEDLKQKIPPRSVMKSTKIGHTVNRLTKHSDAEVAKLAKDIVLSWKRHFEDKLDKPQIEVRCDKQTEAMRKAGRKHLCAALGVPENSKLPECIEREAYNSHGKLASNSYRRSMRALVFALKHQEKVRKKVLDQSLSVNDFVATYRKDSKMTSAPSTTKS